MRRRAKASSLESDPLWYKDAVIYETHVRSFHDSNADGIGDFAGLTEKLDYLKDLGVTALWLLPFYPSPLRDDGYDIADYVGVHPAYGTLKDFTVFLQEAHRRGLRVITELVLNHTSDRHAWFQRARKAPPGSPLRDFYVWDNGQGRYRDARIIFKDFEPSNWTFDHKAQAYFWHRFYSHQPDLNFDNPRVRKALLGVVDFWLEAGVDGMRLDAVPYLFEGEGTNCENLPETHAFLKEVRRHADGRFKDRMFLAEANQWPEDAVAYFGDGDECHMNFHFPLMPRLFMSIRMEDRYPVIDILERTPAIPDACQWALFLRNHDELTLEMVTDEDRDYMYKVYAQDPQARINLGIRRRLAPLLGNHRRKIELMNGLLFSLPGTPVVYYGDEIGMGDNIYLGDRNGVRTPMQWSPDRNAGFSRANPQRLFLPAIIDPEYHYEALNVESQQNNPHSLLWWMKRVIALRKRYRAFSRGTLEFLHPDNRKVLAFLRRHGGETILVVANLSRFVQCVELDLSALKGAKPVELFGRTDFPPVGELPYFLTLGPHGFYWLELKLPKTAEAPEPEAAFPVLHAAAPAALFSGKHRTALEDLLPDYMRSCRWFGGKGRKLTGVVLRDLIPFLGQDSWLALVEADYAEGDPETYVLPLAVVTGPRVEELERDWPHAVIARVEGLGVPAVLSDALSEPAFCETLLGTVARRRRLRGERGELAGLPGRPLREALAGEGALKPTWLRAEQSNTSVAFGERLVLKIFRRPEPGANPDMELCRFLTERARFPHAPPFAGALEYRPAKGEPVAVGFLQGFIPNEGDAWRFTLDELGRFFERALSLGAEGPSAPAPLPLLAALEAEPRPETEHIGAYLEAARLLGRRTAELHAALASDPEDPAFAPEPVTDFYRKALYHGMAGQQAQTARVLRRHLGDLPESAREAAEQALAAMPRVRRRLETLRDRKITSMLIRCHGDYHLGQVLYTGKDFAIIDFEGEPTRSLSWRRIKRSPLRDLAGMIRSFHYASAAALGRSRASLVRPEDRAALEPWARFWTAEVSVAFLKAYLEAAAASALLPKDRAEMGVLLDAYMLEKVLYEIGYEINNRPAWAHIPLTGLMDVLGSEI